MQVCVLKYDAMATVICPHQGTSSSLAAVLPMHSSFPTKFEHLTKFKFLHMLKVYACVSASAFLKYTGILWWVNLPLFTTYVIFLPLTVWGLSGSAIHADFANCKTQFVTAFRLSGQFIINWVCLTCVIWTRRRACTKIREGTWDIPVCAGWIRITYLHA